MSLKEITQASNKTLLRDSEFEILDTRILVAGTKENTELQLLHLFYKDSFVSQTIKTLTGGKDMPSHGLAYAGDLLNGDEIILIEDNNNNVFQIATVLEEKPEEEPPKKKRKMENKVADTSLLRSLRSHPATSSHQVSSGPKPASSHSSTRPTASARFAAMLHSIPAQSAPGQSTSAAAAPQLAHSPAKCSAAVRDDDDDDDEDVSYSDLLMLAVVNNWTLPTLQDVEVLVEIAQDYDRVLDPTLLYDLATDDYLVKIEYWVFAPAPDDPSQSLVATKHVYRYTRHHTK
ncbi:hypothetical protein C8R45DRAFT_948568 [Mycena sanguinolenta]|nr:hypothetical protein C8R45DRAFT_948568 [Mycena sanguinolenta]